MPLTPDEYFDNATSLSDDQERTLLAAFAELGALSL
jgi:hypothetical protein